MSRDEADRQANYPLAAVRKAREERDIDTLLSSLASTNDGVRQAAARSLGLLKEVTAVERLTRLLQARDPGMRVIVAKALGQIGEPRAADGLLRAATDDTEVGVRTTAMKALLTIGDRRAIPLVAGVVTDAALNEKIRSSSMRPRGSARYARRRAARTLREFRGVEALPTLTAAIQEAQGIERWRLRRLARSLARFGSAS